MKAKLILLLLSLSMVTVTCGKRDTSHEADKTIEPTGGVRENGIPVEIFSVSPSHQTTPEDVLQELAFFGAAGGGATCWGDYQYPTIGIIEGRMTTEGEAELKVPLEIVVCGFQPNELIRVTIKFPDGKSTSQEMRASDYSEVWFSYATDFYDPPGMYTFTFEGESGRVEDSINLVRPVEPRVYNDVTSLALYNFEPHERVRVFAYAFTSLVTWQEFWVGSNGQLVVQLEGMEDCGFVVLGDISGEVEAFPREVYESIQRPSYIVAENDKTVRSKPNDDSDVIRQVPSGTRLNVIGTEIVGPVAWTARWWQVRLSDGTEGWVIDGWDVERIVEWTYILNR